MSDELYADGCRKEAHQDREKAYVQTSLNLLGRPSCSPNEIPFLYGRLATDKISNLEIALYADCELYRHEALQPAPERYLQMCRRKLAEAQGY